MKGTEIWSSEDEDDSATYPSPLTATTGDKDGEAQLKYVWDGSGHTRSLNAQTQKDISTKHVDASNLKDEGNKLLKMGELNGSLGCYRRALTILQDAEPYYRSLLHSNISHVYLKMKKFGKAVFEAQKAHDLHPSWSRPLHRIARAHLASGNFEATIQACHTGQKMVCTSAEGYNVFSPLLDEACVLAVKQGRLKQAFAGVQLEVRNAGDDAWLGGPAPHMVELDGPTPDEADINLGPLLALPSNESHHALATWQYGGAFFKGTHQRRTSFRSIKEAVSAAQDGDIIILRKGIHNGMGESITVKKRILICGEGTLGETVIDQRANCPTFRIKRGGVVISNIVLDQTGFRESLLIEGSSHVLIEKSEIKCSGDNAVDVGEGAKVCFSNCTITSKKAGIRSYGCSRLQVENCLIENCGEQGLRAQEKAKISVSGCVIQNCEAEGVVAMDAAFIQINGCKIMRNKGPGIDMSGKGTAVVKSSVLEENVGGVWCWDTAGVSLSYCVLGGGQTHVILADGAATVKADHCAFTGSVHATDHAWKGFVSSEKHNVFSYPEHPTDFPPEEGPFVFIPDRFTRI